MDDNGGHIDHEFHHRGGIHEIEWMGADDPEAVDMRGDITDKMWVDYLSYLEDEEGDNEDFDAEEATEEGEHEEGKHKEGEYEEGTSEHE